MLASKKKIQLSNNEWWPKLTPINLTKRGTGRAEIPLVANLTLEVVFFNHRGNSSSPLSIIIQKNACKYPPLSIHMNSWNRISRGSVIFSSNRLCAVPQNSWGWASESVEVPNRSGDHDDRSCVTRRLYDVP